MGPCWRRRRGLLRAPKQCARFSQAPPPPAPPDKPGRETVAGPAAPTHWARPWRLERR